MAVQNSLTQQQDKKPFSAVISSQAYKRLINNTLSNPKTAARFVTAITSAVSANPALQECDPATIVSAGLLGEGLNLSPSPQLGQYYLVPFDDRRNGRKTAQFMLGYKGYVQLATRSGQYKKINVLPIKAGELIGYDPLNEDIDVNLIQDEQERENAETVGYYAMFEYINGFRKTLYWSKEKMLLHADKYSAAFSKDGCTIRTKKGPKTKVPYDAYIAGEYNPDDEWLYSSFWYKNFDDMACKTMLRQLLIKWGIMSIDLQTAYEADMAVINADGTKEYVDNEPVQTEPIKAEINEVVDIPDKVIPEEETPAADDVSAALFGGAE